MGIAIIFATNMKTYILRASGFLLGIVFILFGIRLLISPLYGNVLEKINAITSIFLGVISLRYGMTGRSRIRRRD